MKNIKDSSCIDKKTDINNKFIPLNNNSQSNLQNFDLNEKEKNFSLSKEESESKQLFDEFDPFQDDKEAQYWDSWRDYFSFCNNKIIEYYQKKFNSTKTY